MAKARNYAREYAEYQGTPDQIKKRAERNKARRMLEKEGKVHKGDGKDVDHKKPIAYGGKTVASNLRAVSVHTNRSYARNSNHKPKAK